jgi:ankyrin repeat protein
LLEKGALPDQVLADGSTALMEAAGSGQSAALELLLKRGANATLRDESGQRALDRAVDLRHADAARLLLRHEVSLGEGEAPLLSALVDWGDSLLLEECLKTGAAIGPDPGRRDPLDRGEEDPSELLRSAARAKDPEMLRLLLRHPNASGAKRPLYLVSALHEAAEVGQAANVKLLIEEAKVDANVLLEGSIGGITRIDPGKPTEACAVAVRGFSALSRALEQGHEEIVRYLVERGAKITGRTRNGGPPLSFVVAHCQMEMLRYFLDHQADTELVDIDGMTALHHAAESGEPAAVQLLLEKGAKADAKDSSGETPLDLARKKGSAEVIRLLEAAGKQGQ